MRWALKVAGAGRHGTRLAWRSSFLHRFHVPWPPPASLFRACGHVWNQGLALPFASVGLSPQPPGASQVRLRHEWMGSVLPGENSGPGKDASPPHPPSPSLPFPLLQAAGGCREEVFGARMRNKLYVKPRERHSLTTRYRLSLRVNSLLPFMTSWQVGAPVPFCRY